MGDSLSYLENLLAELRKIHCKALLRKIGVLRDALKYFIRNI